MPFLPQAVLFVTIAFVALAPLSWAASADQWRSRSIYQVIIDRYALSNGTDPTQCNPADRTWCGGTWNTLRENLDYIQNAGFTAVWISPISKNYDGPTTPYGDPYHGYWVTDASQLNDHFGTSDDLKALSNELHRRGMYLMVDVVVNNVMATSTTPDLSSYMFKDSSQYHPYCPIDWNNSTSIERCWLGDTVVPLPDINTENSAVVSAFGDWIQSFVKEYNVDGLRIDGSYFSAKHVNIDFWPVFCGKAGVFCIGEVFGSDVSEAASFQGPNALDSVLHYPMYYALAEAFSIPGPLNTSAVSNLMAQSKTLFKDTGLLGNFLENQDVPRWHNISVDQQSLYNAMVFNFMSDGIPIVYYGQEQYLDGFADPYNRAPLWPSNYANTTAYQLVTTLNKFRNFLAQNSTWLYSSAEPLTVSEYGLAIMKGNVVSVMTNIGSPVRSTVDVER
ncbi:hypothetical protein ID866_4637 [Astraeus odoratus]|nr:hypothetical protein ID866_4637 [Astraeus odoratus]